MNKLLSLILMLLLSIGLVAGCGDDKTPVDETTTNEGSQESNQGEAYPVAIKDALDEEVIIEEQPERIVSLIPSNTEIAYELGLGEEIVGVSDFDNYPEDTADKEKIGGQEMNIEKIISLKPDLVLAHASSAHNSTEGFQQLKDAGIPVLVVNEAQNFDQVYESIEMIGKASGKQQEAGQIVSEMKEEIEAIKEKAQSISQKKSVFIEVSPAPEIYTPGKNTFMDEMLSIINAENASGDLEGWAKIDQEAVVEKNPDVIITTYGYYTENAVEQVLSRDGWKDVTAIKDKQVYDVHSDLVARSGPRLAEGVEELAKAVYPETFNK
ncbi:ABC transporter substrate-binding protein [Pseudalkalibacillus salsuginis]|uniref:ABC transporter substrate-binding protein n=1 Tax=Pseudalkalibacillus salsuginis TaxID=2910972 RepID=UPI001F365F84|nr:ABC transporter substrate-binding protein [Pseudalkalibacillus salsuginis]MCF6411685.1 ABC transporter substrate-binding protein [Pseudalkalibacillus salsuginis]